MSGPEAVAGLSLSDGERLLLSSEAFVRKPLFLAYALTTGFIVTLVSLISFATYGRIEGGSPLGILFLIVLAMVWLRFRYTVHFVTTERVGMLSGWTQDSLVLKAVSLKGASAVTGLGRTLTVRSASGDKLVFRWMTWKDMFDFAHVVSQRSNFAVGDAIKKAAS